MTKRILSILTIMFILAAAAALPVFADETVPGGESESEQSMVLDEYEVPPLKAEQEETPEATVPATTEDAGQTQPAQSTASGGTGNSGKTSTTKTTTAVKTSTAAKTGDESNFLRWIVLGTVAVGGTIAAVVVRKKTLF